MNAFKLQHITANMPILRKMAVETWHKSQITNILTRAQLLKVLEANYLPDVPQSILKMPPHQRRIEIEQIIETALQERERTNNDAPPTDNAPPAETAPDPQRQALQEAKKTPEAGLSTPIEATSVSASDDAELTALEQAAVELADAAHCKIAAERAARDIQVTHDALEAQITAWMAQSTEVSERLKAARAKHGAAKARLISVAGKQTEVAA